MRRRALLIGVPAALAAVPLIGCDRRPPSREEMLRELAVNGVVTDTNELDASSRKLSEDLARLEAHPSASLLESARASWRRAALAWKRAACFGLGPLVETNALVRAAFWPVRLAPVEQLIAGSSELDDRAVAELGVDVKGLYCLEALLFTSDAPSKGLDAAGATRRRALAAALARSVADHARRVQRSLGDGEALAAELVGDVQASVSQVVERLVVTVEHVAAQRLALVAELEKNGMLKPSLVEGAPSGSSHALALAELLAAERLYRGTEGKGPEALVAATAPAIRDRLDERFAHAVTTLRAVAMPLEHAAVSNRDALAAAAAAGKALELALKVDVASALGVTVTFASTDGD